MHLFKKICTSFKFGGPGVIRTRDLLVRSQTLYPAELQSRNVKNIKFGGPGVIRTRDLLVRSQTLYPAELQSHNLTRDII